MLECLEQRKALLEHMIAMQPVIKNQNDRIDLTFMRAMLHSGLMLYTDGAKIESDDPRELKEFLERFSDACRAKRASILLESIDDAHLRDALMASALATECDQALKAMKEGGLIVTC